MGHVSDRWTRPDPADPKKRMPTSHHGKGKRYRARWTDPDGKERERSFKLKAAADAHVRDMDSKMAAGDYIDPARGTTTIGEFADRWLEATTGKPSADVWRRGMVATHIKPRWGTTPVGRITKAAAQEWLGQKTREPSVRRRKRDASGNYAVDAKGQPAWEMRPLSASRVRALAFALHAIVQHAVDDHALPRNPLDGLDLPKMSKHHVKGLQPEGLAALRAQLATYDPRTLMMAEVLAFSGLRWSEVVGLDVTDFDGDRSLHVRQATPEVNGRLTPGTPKSHRERVVPIPRPTAAALKDSIGARKSGPLLPGPRGGRWVRSTWNRRWEAARIAAGCPTATPHDLRHTFVSQAIAAGADLKVIQHLVGHAQASTTSDVYGHLFPGRLTEVADALDAIAAANLPARSPQS